MLKRTTISGATRLAVLERDGYSCRYCWNQTGPFHMDHVRPWSWGGDDSLENLVTACIPCNLSKGAAQWLPLPLPEVNPTPELIKQAVQRRLVLQRIAVSRGHSPSWTPVGRKRALWWCTCGHKLRYPLHDRADLLVAIRGHLMDALGESYQGVIDPDPHPPMFLEAS